MSETIRFLIDRIGTPLGELAIVSDEEGRLRLVGWTDKEDWMEREFTRQYGKRGFSLHPVADPFGLSSALKAYFEGDLHAIDTLPVATGGTPFQRETWQALREIPCGETISYGTLAQRIGRPEAVRAVGLANGANPVGIVVPCHRVIGSNGTLTGYGGGIERKRWLLAHERRAGASPELPFLT